MINVRFKIINLMKLREVLNHVYDKQPISNTFLFNKKIKQLLPMSRSIIEDASGLFDL